MAHPRTLIRLTGSDRASFLQGIITQDIALLETQPAIFTAMLSPQGKWQHDFFIFQHGDAFYIDHDAATADIFLKRLKLYKLRAEVTIEPLDGWQLALMPRFEDGTPVGMQFQDPRHPELPARYWAESVVESPISAEDYLAMRLAHGIPEGGVDVTEKETALDVGYDLLNAVSFTKGCYVGQEVTARMHYKSVVRKGFFQVTADAPLPEETTITCDGKPVAELRSRSGNQGIAFGRIDAVLVAMESDTPPDIDGLIVQLCPPAWQDKKIALYHQQLLEKAGSPTS